MTPVCLVVEMYDLASVWDFYVLIWTPLGHPVSLLALLIRAVLLDFSLATTVRGYIV